MDNYDYTNFDEESLITRGKYLVEVIDKLDNKATHEDIARLPNGKVIVPWGPGSGKSSAIRQYIINHPTLYIVYSCMTIDEVMKFYYDLVSQIKYLQSLGNTRIPNIDKIQYFTKDHDVKSLVLQSSNVIICTHERLLIEPPRLLYRAYDDYRDITYRDYVFIDEMTYSYKDYRLDSSKISQLYTSYLKYKDLSVLNHTNWKTEALVELSNILSDTSSLSFLDKSLSTTILSLLSSNNIKISSNDKEGIERKTHFAIHLIDKVAKYASEYNEDSSMMSSISIFYSVNDIIQYTNNLCIFDGTGDILLKNSDWTIASTNLFPRRLLLNNPIQIIPDTYVLRNSTNNLINQDDYLDNLVSSIRSLLSNHDKLLIYTWKSISVATSLNDEDSSDQFVIN